MGAAGLRGGESEVEDVARAGDEGLEGRQGDIEVDAPGCSEGKVSQLFLSRGVRTESRTAVDDGRYGASYLLWDTA